MIGEIGGDAEERAAAYIKDNVTKPVVGYVAGFTAPEGKTMGHAGAIVSGSSGTAAAKKEALEAVGVKVGKTPSETAAADAGHPRGPLTPRSPAGRRPLRGTAALRACRVGANARNAAVESARIGGNARVESARTQGNARSSRRSIRAFVPTRRVHSCVRADSAGSNVRSRRLGGVQTCVRADSAGGVR